MRDSRSPSPRRRSRSPPRRSRSPRRRSRSRSRDRRSRSKDNAVDRRYNSQVDSTGKKYKECGQKSNVIGIFNMDFNTSERKLEREMERFGRVQRVVIVERRDSRRSAGYGFVTFDHEDDAEDAVKSMNGQMFDGREVRVDFSFTKTRSDRDERRRSRSRSRDRRPSRSPRRRSRSRSRGRR